MSAAPDAQPQVPLLRLDSRLVAAPLEGAREAAPGSAHAWQFLHTTPEDAARDRRELDRQDRAVVALRKQVHAARNEAQAARAAVTQHPPAPLVWGTGALAAIAGFGWLYERRRRMALEQPDLFTTDAPVMPPGPMGFPAAVEPTGVSEFSASEPAESHYPDEDEADRWIRRAGLSLPDPDAVRGAQ